jgi:uncharacterized repeat protein (TIGR02543 family)
MAVVKGVNAGFVLVEPTADPDANVQDSASFVQAGIDVAPAGATASKKVGFYMQNSPSGGTYRIGIYADNAGACGALLGFVDTTSLVQGWNRQALVIDLTPGLAYHPAVHLNNTDVMNTEYSDSATEDNPFRGGLSALPDPFGTPGFTLPRTPAIYIQYEGDPTYAMEYDANGGTGSQTDASSPYAEDDTVTVLDKGTMARAGYVFSHWNTAADDSGTDYDPSATFAMPAAAVKLYAQWVPLPATKVAQASNYSSGTGTTMDVGPFDIAAGDILVAFNAWEDGDVGTLAIADSAEAINQFTLYDRNNYGGSYGCIGVLLNAAAKANAMIRVTYGTGRPYHHTGIFQFRPATGKIVSVAVAPVYGSANSIDITTPTFSTTGPDDVVVAGYKSYDGRDVDDLNVYVGSDNCDYATETLRPSDLCFMWHKIKSGAYTDVAATTAFHAPRGSASAWIAHAVAIKIADVGVAIPVAMHHYSSMRR